ncbi:N,N-dimethylformamidase beta subunit family domain-containing protein [Pseudomonas baltica]|uniref:N,N-dimethylformamidase beta subunit family domain-containing protein n=1 Tax=Pseudomonas baltica TaxID=2762576 RepID=UPI00289D4753|nr:N,N-dimethylformamidase beta subunit family domain-containing protein [Pseudomonas baltica]
MHRLTDHSSLPIMGYPSTLSARPGERLGFHLSCVTQVLDTQVVRLDRLEQPALRWPLQGMAQAPGVQGFELGSWIEVPVAEASGWMTFDLLLTANQGERVVLSTADFECRYLPQVGVSLISGAERAFAAVALPRDIWLTMRFEWNEQVRRICITEGARVLCDQQCSGARGGIDGINIAADWAQRSPTLNARVATITAAGIDGVSVWPLPIQPVDRVADQHGHRAALIIHGAPTWAARGPAWTGDYHDPRGAPEQYAAVHLHEDDRPAFDWPESLSLTIPAQTPSGVYALRVRSASGQADIAFVVLPAQPARGLLFALPTLTYQAYANEALPEALYPWQLEDPGHRAAQQNRWLSLYDSHQDGSGVSLATWPCPWTTVREDYQYPLCGGPHGLPVDLHMLRFFADNGVAVEVISDHDLHRDPNLLDGCTGVITGSHPEYWTTPMLDALQAYIDGGGNLAYLGGNGFYWVAALDEQGTLEVRRGQRGVRTWESAPGENHLSITGEPGGLWRWRGRPEHRLLGVGTAAMGFTRAQPYARTPASYEPAWAWVFEGVTGERIDAAGILLGGAAGYEIDRTSRHWGTPANTVVLACAESFDDSYELDTGEQEPHEGPRRRADLCIRRSEAGGLVFAVGSVCWGGALPAWGEANSVGQVTLNVLRAFQVRP